MATMNPFDEYNTEDAAGKGTKKKKKNLALNQGPVSNVKVYDDLPGGEKRVLPDFGAGRIGKVRLKKGKV
tara:strand:+ start:226 stop:435 length:210 start_codon:yes stop_codon:yes gene_type:complete